jgi:hypothetical protein
MTKSSMFLLPALLLALLTPAKPVEQDVAKIVTKGGIPQLEIQGKSASRPFWDQYAGLSPIKPYGRYDVGGGFLVATERSEPGRRSTLFLYKGNQVVGRLDLYAEVQKWLRSDRLWGGHATANEMRYLDARAPLGPRVTETVPQSDGTALAVIDYMGESALSLTVQANLVRITLNPFKVTHLKSLDPMRDWHNATSPKRLYRYGSNLFVIAGSSLLRYSRGKLSKWATLPWGTIGLANGRWLAMSGLDDSDPRGREAKVVVLDLATRRQKRLYEWPGNKPPGQAWFGDAQVYLNSRYVSVSVIVPNPGETYTGENYRVANFAVDIETAKVTRLANDLRFIGDYGYCLDRKPSGASTTGGAVAPSPPATKYLIYSLKTGRLVQQLRFPPGFSG